MAERARRRRICSYDLAEVPADAYIITDIGGEGPVALSFMPHYVGVELGLSAHILYANERFSS